MILPTHHLAFNEAAQHVILELRDGELGQLVRQKSSQVCIQDNTDHVIQTMRGFAALF